MGRLNPCRETKFSGTHGDREIFNFPVQLTTSRIGNLTGLIHTLLYVITTHIYIPYSIARDGTAESVSRYDTKLSHAYGDREIRFSCSADDEQDWQPYPVDPYSATCDDHTYLHTYIEYCNERREQWSARNREYAFDLRYADTRPQVFSSIDLRN